jgi:3,4-dihydroxy 2-butanone 4-phosphate synthase/GTP cyclohydrolase II
MNPEVRAAVDAIAAGRGVVVIDDEDRENEGDVVFAADTVTAAQMAFMMRECGGLICVALAPDVVDRLALPLMVADNRDPHRTAFTVSVDARVGTTTGIAASERALTARLLADPGSAHHDFISPGHLFPLRAVAGGVHARRGHTEAAVDLARHAGRQPAGVICEIAGADGEMLRGAALVGFARDHEMPVVTIHDLVTNLTAPVTPLSPGR